MQISYPQNDAASARMLQLQALLAFNALMEFAYKNVEIGEPGGACAQCHGKHSMTLPLACSRRARHQTRIEFAFCRSCGWRGSRPLSD